MTNSEPHSPSKEKTRTDFGGASQDPNAALHDESPEEFEEALGEELNQFEPRPDPDDQSEEAEDIRKRNQKARNDLNDKLRAEANDDEKDKAGFDKGEKTDFEADGAKYTGSKLRDYLMYGISDKGAYYKYANSKQVSDKQLRRMIIRAHLDKGWTEMRFYKKGGTIDSQLTSRAQNMIATEFANSKLPALQSIAQNVRVQGVPDREVEPWRKLNPMAHLDKAVYNIKSDLSSAWQRTKQDTTLGDQGILASLFPSLIGNADKPRAPNKTH